MSADVRLTSDERDVLHRGVCPRHRDDVPGVHVCKPCETAGDLAVELIITRRLDDAEARASNRLAQSLDEAYTGGVEEQRRKWSDLIRRTHDLEHPDLPWLHCAHPLCEEVTRG